VVGRDRSVKTDSLALNHRDPSVNLMVIVQIFTDHFKHHQLKEMKRGKWSIFRPTAYEEAATTIDWKCPN
jgi:hypothetical protein